MTDPRTWLRNGCRYLLALLAGRGTLEHIVKEIEKRHRALRQACTEFDYAMTGSLGAVLPKEVPADSDLDAASLSHSYYRYLRDQVEKERQFRTVFSIPDFDATGLAAERPGGWVSPEALFKNIEAENERVKASLAKASAKFRRSVTGLVGYHSRKVPELKGQPRLIDRFRRRRAVLAAKAVRIVGATLKSEAERKSELILKNAAATRFANLTTQAHRQLEQVRQRFNAQFINPGRQRYRLELKLDREMQELGSGAKPRQRLLDLLGSRDMTKALFRHLVSRSVELTISKGGYLFVDKPSPETPVQSR